jgi:RNA polymerase sigma-70 factor, ECF subfamily
MDGLGPGGAHDSELALAARAAEGEEAALRSLLGRVTERLRRIAWHMTYDHYDAQDLVQEALLHVSRPRVLDAYRGDGPVDGYLLSAGVRAMISARRTRRFQEWRELELTAEPAPSPSHGDATAEQALAHVLAPELSRAMSELPDRARAVVLLIVLGELSYEECAEAVGMPVGTVRSTYSRARTLLQRRLRGADAPS